MWVGIGVGIGRNRFATGIFNDYALRVNADGGITEAGQCVDAVTGILLNASLLLIPSGYKGGKLYAEIPTNGNGDLTWTRGSDAFRTNASGLLQRVPWNLLSYSEQFDNASWLKSSATVTANSTTAPDGNTTADKLVGAGNNPLIYQSTSTLTGKYTFSIYGKKGELSWLRLTNSSAGTNAVWFDLNNGAVGTLVGAGNSANITSVGNGWYRCEFIINSFDSSQPTDLVIACTNADNTTTGYTGNSVDGLFIWGAQLVEGTTAQTYLPTTDRLNFPRLSYMYGSCPSALLEPQRTNLALQSETFDNASWTKNASATITANSTTAPDGNTTADTLTVSASTFSGLYQVISGSSAIYTISVYVKKGTKNWFYFLNTTGTIQAAWFDLNNGILGTVTSGYTATMTSVGNGWYRCSVSQTTNQLLSYFQFGLSDANNSSLPSSSGTAFIWGAQVEVGAYPTTYIPTTSATATRVADSFSRNNIYTNGLISASGGTWFVSLVNNVAMVGDAGGDAIVLGDIASTAGNNFRLYNPPSSSRMQIFKTVASGATPIYTTTSDTVKIAIKWNGTTADVFANGTKVVSATAFTTTAMEYFWTNITGVPKFIQQMALFNSPLTDTQCQNLTT